MNRNGAFGPLPFFTPCEHHQRASFPGDGHKKRQPPKQPTRLLRGTCARRKACSSYLSLPYSGRTFRVVRVRISRCSPLLQPPQTTSNVSISSPTSVK